MFGLIITGTRIALASSAVYITVDSGVWKDAETTEKLYSSFTTQTSTYLSPYMDKIPISLPDLGLPRTGSVVSTIQNTWNAGIIATCKFLAVAPICAVGYAKKGINYAKEQLQGISAQTSEG